LTYEGRAVARLIDRAGVWLRAGMTGLVTGLDLAQALVSLPADADREFSRELLIAAEAAFVSAVLRRAEETSKETS